MTDHLGPDPAPDDGHRPWPRRIAIAFCVGASVVGWVAIASLLIGVMDPHGPQIADEKNPAEALSDIAPAAGLKPQEEPDPTPRSNSEGSSPRN